MVIPFNEGGPRRIAMRRCSERFFKCAMSDLPHCDLLLVLGTSLAVHPFAGLVTATAPGTPRVLINRERVGERLGSRGLDFDGGNDAFVQGDCDAAVVALCQRLGWEAELRAVIDASAAASV